jgi:hypothetical protein
MPQYTRSGVIAMDNLQKYMLRENPFDIYSHQHNMANRQEEWKTITSSLVSAFEGKGPRYFLLLGDYGVGKSFTLEQIYRWVAQGSGKGDVFVVYQKRDVLYERRLALQESEPRWAKFGLDLVMRIFDNIEHERLIETLKKAKLTEFKSRFGKLFQSLRDGEEIAFKYITGEKLSAKELRQLELTSPITDSPTSLVLFFEFLRVIKSARYSSFLLLLDEFEYITTQGERRITQILNTFRQIFDGFGDYDARYSGAIAKPIFMLATSPGGWDSLKELEAASIKKTGGAGIAPFMERLSPRDMIQLKAFSLEHTIELVGVRLSEMRTAKVADPLFPFTRKAVEFIHSVSFNKPRNVIQYCGILLEDAAREGLEKIDEKDARRILEKYGVYATEKETGKKP